MLIVCPHLVAVFRTLLYNTYDRAEQAGHPRSLSKAQERLCVSANTASYTRLTQLHTRSESMTSPWCQLNLSCTLPFPVTYK